MSDIIVSQLSIYPVKSLRGIAQQNTHVDNFGLKNDRRWMVVDEAGVMITQRKISQMCLIQSHILDDGIKLSLSSMDSLLVKTPTLNITSSVKVWDDELQAYDAGEESAQWLSQALSIKCRLVYFPDTGIRQVDLDYAQQGDKTAFSDGFPILLISQASLDDLNQRLVSPISMSRFRPNLVVQGCEAFAEDSWKKIRIGEITFRIVKPCSRCAIPNINIETAQRDREPLKTLLNYRKKGNKVFFGQNVIADKTGEINVGMEVEIL